MRKFIRTLAMTFTIAAFYGGAGGLGTPLVCAQHDHDHHDVDVRQYVLQTGNLRSTATFDGSTLVIDDGVHPYAYSRMESRDSRDGQQLGFYNRELDKTIRFPIFNGGRIQLEAAYGNWRWSRMNVTPVAVNQVTAAPDVHEAIDQLALVIQQQAQELSVEAHEHYQSTPEYRHLAADTQDLQSQSSHLHELAHGHGSIDHMVADIAKLDKSFHHLEETFDRIEKYAVIGFGVVDGHTAHVKELLNSMENNLHQIQEIALTLQRHTVLKPAFGQFRNVEELAVQLEKQSNDLLLDMHYNYSHNSGYDATYREAYGLLEAAKQVHGLAHDHNHNAIKLQLAGLDGLVHHLEHDMEDWSRHHHRQFGNTDVTQKVSSVEATVAALMIDAGVKPSVAPVPPQNSGPEVAPRPR